MTTTQPVAVRPELDAPADLPAAIRDVKQQLRESIGDVEALFGEVEEAIRERTAAIVGARERGADVIPVVQASDIATGLVPADTADAIRDRGCAVVRQTFPVEQALAWDAELADYLERNRFADVYTGPIDSFFGTLSSSRPQIYPVYWSMPQVQARQDERMSATRAFMDSLWKRESEGRTWFDPSRQLSYADRIRRRQPGDSSFGLSPHVDSGSVERWLVPAYQKVYRHVLSGHWRDYDPWDAAYRTEVDEFTSQQMCSVFRSFQGWTALSEMQPTDGVLHLVPIPEAIVYLLLRALQPDVADDDLCGAEVGRVLSAQEKYLPALDGAHTPIPAMQPGDTVWWHADTIHSVTVADSAPWCDKNAAYAARQKETFLAGGSPSDFAAEDYEARWPDRAHLEDLTTLGRQQMGLADW